MSGVGARRRRTLGTIALVVLIVAVPLGVFIWGRTSNVFSIRHIDVTGARPGHSRALRDVLRQRFLGTNLFLATGSRVRAALAGFPYVDQVAINRDFPDTLKVRMTEYVPAALLQSDGRWYVVSAEGRVLAEASQPGSASPQAGESSPGVASSGAATPGAASPGAASPGAVASPSVTPSGGAAGATGAQGAGSSASSGQTAASGAPSGSTGGSSTTGSPSGSASPSSTSLPQPTSDVVLPRGTRHLPVVVTAAPVTVGGTVTDARTRAALAVLAALPRTLSRTALGASATDTSIRVYERGGPTFEFGDASSLAAKMVALKAVLGRYRARHVTCAFVDVSVPDRPLGAPLLPAPSVQAPTATSSTAPSGTGASAPASSPSGTPTGTPAGTPQGTPSGASTSKP